MISWFIVNAQPLSPISGLVLRAGSLWPPWRTAPMPACVWVCLLLWVGYLEVMDGFSSSGTRNNPPKGGEKTPRRFAAEQAAARQVSGCNREGFVMGLAVLSCRRHRDCSFFPLLRSLLFLALEAWLGPMREPRCCPSLADLLQCPWFAAAQGRAEVQLVEPPVWWLSGILHGPHG